ncbi:MAG: TetR/AcrR family transcriptional regulator [Planctomycetaceae bacterium]|nr:TetR/AcrR family transcriptional regulator [Planctomycetaceae bacterium]
MRAAYTGAKIPATPALRQKHRAAVFAILDAAERVILRDGYGGATLDNIATEAKLSKGGLMHYFRSKREIIDGVLDRLRDRLADERDSVPQNGNPADPARASLISILNLVRAGCPALTGLVAMLGENEIRARLANARARLFGEIGSDAPHPEKIAIAMLLLEGLWLDNSIGRSAFCQDVGSRVVNELTRLLESL